MLLLASLFVFMGNTALAAHSQKEAETASTEATDPVRDATVNLYCRLKADGRIYSSSGSGVVVSERGVILTNAHVAQYFLLADDKNNEKPSTKRKVTGRCSVRTGSPAKERYTASVFYFPSMWVKENASELQKKAPKGTGENDFALLYITDAKKAKLPERFPSLPISLAIDTIGSTQGTAITVAGYPSEKLDFDGMRKSLAAVTSSTTVTNIQSFGIDSSPDILTLAPSAAGSIGVSGGPVVDSSGEIVGIVTTKSAAKDNRTLRAITLSYIDRALRSHTHLPLAFFLSDDPRVHASTTSETIPPEILNVIANGLLKKK